jgi:uncharacterized protein with FMN-binding domain
MKKLLLSGLVIGLFLVYGLHQQEEAQNAVQTVAPQQQVPSTPSTPVTPAPSQAGSGNAPTPTPSSAAANPPAASGQYKNGTYTGSAADAFYGYIQVQAVISGGRISDVIFLQYPSDRSTSIAINTQAMPYLKQEALAVQSAQVDIVSGATDSSMAFQQSLASALAQAH